VYVASDGEMIQVDNRWYLLEMLLKVLNLVSHPQWSLFSSLDGIRGIYPFEMIPEFDHRDAAKHPVVVHDELAIFQHIDVALDQKQVRTRLHGKEARAGNIDSTSILEILYCCACSRFQLVHRRKPEIISERRYAWIVPE